MWIEYNCNPKHRRIDDCTVRALSKATGKSWRECHDILADQSRDMGLMMDDKAVWGKVLKDMGFVKVIIPEWEPDDYTLRDFCKKHNKGNFIVATNNHVVAVDNGDYYDTFDSGDENPVFYWRN